MGVIGYKVFNPDWTCRGFQYEVGKTFKHDGDIKMCGSGFHFCLKLSACFNYYTFDSVNKVAVVEAIGDVITKGDKSVTNEIKIVKELSWYEILDLCNTGYFNTGNWNTGNCNTGNWNTGNCNTGNWNTGDWNITSNITGFFNTVEPQRYIFNKSSDVPLSVVHRNPGYIAMTRVFSLNTWVPEEKMSEEEKERHPECLTTGGYLKRVDYKTACKIMWSKMTDKEKSAVKDLPNFDADIFEEITGIRVD